MYNSRFIDDFKLIAAADQSDRLLKKANDQGIKKIYHDYKELLNSETLDAVIISLPNFLHLESIELAAEKGIDILVDKPLANTSEECKEIIKILSKHGVKLMQGANYRFFESVQKTKQVLDEGGVGEIRIATLELIMNGPFTHPLSPRHVPEWWFDEKKSGGGSLFDLGFHLIDLFNWFFPNGKVVYASFGYHYNLNFDDNATVILYSEDADTRGIINVGWFSREIFPDFNFRVNLHGTAGNVSTEHFAPKNLYIHAAKEATKNIIRKLTGQKINPLTYTYYHASFVEILKHFSSCIKNDEEPPVTALDGYNTIKIIEEATELAKIKKLDD